MSKDKEGQVIQYIEGFAWGIKPNGETVCLGTEVDIKETLVSSQKKLSNPVVAQIISLERRLSKEQSEKKQREKKKVLTEKKERRELAISRGLAN